MRAQFGCDRDAPQDVWTSSCPDCGGDGCLACNNRGARAWRRCPASMTDAGAMFVLRCASAFEDGILPLAGGLGDQPSKLMRLIDLARGEKCELQKAAPKE